MSTSAYHLLLLRCRRQFVGNQMDCMGIFRYLVQLTRRVAHAVTVRDEPPDFAVKVDTPLTRRIAHAVTVRVWVRWLSLINRYARSQVCQSQGRLSH